MKSSSYSSTTSIDTFLLVISDSGIASKGKHISLSSKSTSVSIALGNNALRTFGDYYIYAGYSQGYYTKINSASFSNAKTNTMVMKYLFDKDSTYSCVYEFDLPSSQVN